MAILGKDKGGRETPQDTASLHTVDTPRGEELDLLGGRFEIQIQNPLPEFANEYCKAYKAVDRDGEYQRIYALIGYNEMPFRDRATEAMQKGSIPHLIRCHATGSVTLSDTRRTHRAFILQRPAGKKLTDILSHSGSLPETFIITHVIRPVAKMIMELEAFGINHGCINLDTIYYDKEITVEDCCALPSGILQKTTYESPDRLISIPQAKGAGETSGDYYSLGILSLHLYLGYLPNEKLNKNDLLEKIFLKGAYNAFIPEVELSESFQDFLRGTINEDRTDRWNRNQMEGWLSGKRYSAIAPSEPKDSVRPFTHNRKDFFTRGQIAHYLYKDWKSAKINLSTNKLMRWLESNIKKTDVCTQVERVVPISIDDSPNRPLKDEELARLLVALDPQAPLRYRLTAFNTDGLGPALVEAFRQDSPAALAQLMAILDNNLISYADSMLEGIDNPVSGTVMWRLQGLRPIMKNKGFGFGKERILYQLNPSLCCQQKMLLPHYCYSIKDILTTLNNLATRHAKTTALADRHIAAFITNRLEIYREVRIVELSKFPDMADDENLVMLKILTMAQQKIKNRPLPGLSMWIIEMIMPTLDKIKQTSKREKVKKKVIMLAEKGLLERISFMIFNRDLFAYDRREHTRAEALFRFHQEMLSHLQDRAKIRLKARVFGQQIAWFVGVMVLMAVVIHASKPYM
jgi:hypothetical protein